MKPDLILPPGVRLPANRERRDPTAATRPLQYTSPGMVQVPEWDADKAYRLGYIANVAAYRCVQIIANAISSVDIVTGKTRQKRTDVNPTSRLAKLLGPPPGGPSVNMSARRLIAWSIGQKIITGRYAWEIETADGRDDGLPVALWPLVSARLDAVPSSSGNDWFRVFQYGRSGAKKQLKPGFVFYDWNPSGLDYRQPESALQACRYDLTLVTMADQYGIAFLRNNAVPAAVVTTTSFPNVEARERFRRQWESDMAGPLNAGRTHFMEVSDEGDGPVGESIDVKVLGLSAKDSQLAEQRKDALMEIAMGLGVPWSKLDASGRTYDNAEVEDRTFWEERLLPEMRDFEDAVNMRLAPRLGDEVAWFDLTQVRALQRKQQPVTQTVGAPSLVQAQLMWINEARADYGLVPVEGGDRMMTVAEIQALRMGQAAEPGARSAEPPRSAGGKVEPTPVVVPAGLPSPDHRAAGESGGREAPGVPVLPERSPAAEHRAIDPEAMELRRARIWRTADATVRTLEASWERAWKRLFTKQAEAVQARLTGKRGRQALGYGADGQPLEQRADGDPAPQIDPEELFSRSFWTQHTAEVSMDLIEQAAALGFARISDLFGVAFDVSSPYAADFIQGRAFDLAGQVTATTYEAIRAQLVEGVSLGESIPKLAERITHVFDVATSARSTVIARTEVISAYNGSATLAAAQLPQDVAAGQEWIATRDSRTREAHASADGQVVPIGTAFDVGGDQLAYPGDPSGRAKNTVQCRCTIAFLTPEEMTDRSARGEVRVPARTARALMRMVPHGAEFDLLGLRRAFEEVAA